MWNFEFFPYPLALYMNSEVDEDCEIDIDEVLEVLLGFRVEMELDFVTRPVLWLEKQLHIEYVSNRSLCSIWLGKRRIESSAHYIQHTRRGVRGPR